jgi:hypothetical protein
MDWMPGEARARPLVPAGADGTLTTRPVRFSGEHLFVNADLRGGQLRVSVLDLEGRLIPPFSLDACSPVTGDGTRLAVKWTGVSLKPLAGRVVRFRFSMSRGRLYAFWVSRWPSGESGGYPAAGGPEFAGPIDTRA